MEELDSLHPFLDLRHKIKGYRLLEALALDLLCAWNRKTDQIWETLDPILWEYTHNPWVVLQTVSREKLEVALSDSSFVELVERLLEANKNEQQKVSWFKQNYAHYALSCVAYFSMEYMLSEALPIYSGGLGNVAGDQLKSASDLGVPVVGVGLLYQQGYFRQLIDKYGVQQALYPYNDPGQLPITPLRKSNGEWLRLEIPLPGWSLWLRTWQVKIGRVTLYLLDTNDPANFPAHRGITSELYGGGSELRIKQEMVLGIGGWRLLHVLGLRPEVCHLNEGHAAFAILERARLYMKETGLPFHSALAVIRAGNVFTTHTAVTAGFDRFAPNLIEQYLGRYTRNQLQIPIEELMALGREDPNNKEEYFNMAYLAIRGSSTINGVSRLHGDVSRQLFQSLFSRWPKDEIPVKYVTNGVHVPSWDSAAANDLWTEACGQDRWLNETSKLTKEIEKIPDNKIWNMRQNSRQGLVEFARSRLSRQLSAQGADAADIEHAKTVFDPTILTLGFARRFATYKRPTMLLHDQERLIRILTHPTRPVQLILAGKAHPADKPGQEMIQAWIQFIISRPECKAHIIFLSDYDIFIAKQLVQGVDVWVNNPRRPWEACGTSGMKVLVNGGINLSELDGWWAEAYTPEVGWSLGDGLEHGADPNVDALEANQLYDQLEQQVIPEFYDRDAQGIPTKWISRIRKSMARLTPHYSANRTVREYTEQYYLPAAQRYLQRTENKEWSNQFTEWKKNIESSWSSLKFIEVSYETKDNHYEFSAKIEFNQCNPNDVKVELFANMKEEGFIEVHEMKQVESIQDSGTSTYLYTVSVPAKYPVCNYTARIVPYFPSIEMPLEMPHILWQH